MQSGAKGTLGRWRAAGERWVRGRKKLWALASMLVEKSWW